MEVVNNEWIMKGCAWNSPDCLHSPKELLVLIEEIGFLPLFSNRVPGFSVEEHTWTNGWWTGDLRCDPWEWRQILARDERVAYGKFFDKKAGFISKQWFPVFANYRRDGYDFDALNDDGLVPYRHKKLMDALETDESMRGLEILSCELKDKAGFGKNGEKNFEGVLTALQMQTYLLMGDFRQKRNKRGEGYGWHLATLKTPETKWGYEFVGSRYTEKPGDSWLTIAARTRQYFPEAKEEDIRKMLAVRYPTGTSV
jgi:hypothetical protein